MRRRTAPKPRLPALADFRIRTCFSSGDADAWDLIKQWHKERLVSVQPVTRHAAWIEITDKGKEKL